MRLESLTVKNVRLYGEKDQTIVFDKDKHITVLLGDNGAGKTTLLDTCSILLSNLFEHFPDIAKKDFIQDDVRNETNDRKADYLHCAIQLSASPGEEQMELNLVENSKVIEVEINRKGNQTTIPDSVLKPIKDYSLAVKNRIDAGDAIALPILAYYGTERGNIKTPERRRDFNDIFPRWEAYRDSLESSTTFKRFFTWFERLEDLERREQQRLKDFDYTLYELNVVRRALGQLFQNYINPRVEVSPLRFVMDDITNPENPIETRIDRMSDGYRITIALVADIAGRIAEANPSSNQSGLEDSLLAHGIVLIDEIDLHLHPSLQREILRKLHIIFPNVQFIVSTHSPNVVLGALDLVQIVKLNDGIIDDKVNERQYEKYDISLILLSNLFELDNVRTNTFKDLEELETQLLNKDSLSKKELDELKSITRTLRAYGYADGGKW